MRVVGVRLAPALGPEEMQLVADSNQCFGFGNTRTRADAPEVGASQTGRLAINSRDTEAELLLVLNPPPTIAPAGVERAVFGPSQRPLIAAGGKLNVRVELSIDTRDYRTGRIRSLLGQRC